MFWKFVKRFRENVFVMPNNYLKMHVPNKFGVHDLSQVINIMVTYFI